MVEIEANIQDNNQDKQRVKNGSFQVSIPMGRKVNEEELVNGLSCYFPKEFEQMDTSIYTVQMLTQNDYADGWRQIIPNAKRYYKKYTNTNGDTHLKSYLNAFRMKINLAQLPEYLWHRMQYVDDNTHYVSNCIHHYIIEKSNVDDEIYELVNILKQHHKSEYKERVNELLTILKDNDVYGWVVIRAKSMYRN
jgi:hypothetical protein